MAPYLPTEYNAIRRLGFHSNGDVEWREIQTECVCFRYNRPSDVDGERRRRQIHQNPRPVSPNSADWRQVRVASRAEGNLRHSVQVGRSVGRSVDSLIHFLID